MLVRMIEQILARIDAIDKREGKTGTRVARDLTGNGRLYQRLQDRLKYEQELMKLLDKYEEGQE